jgi:hypothetical protein
MRIFQNKFVRVHRALFACSCSPVTVDVILEPFHSLFSVRLILGIIITTVIIINEEQCRALSVACVRLHHML